MRRLNTIKVRVAAGSTWQEATNAAIERVEKAGDQVVQVVDRHYRDYDSSGKRKTDDWFVTLLVETVDG